MQWKHGWRRFARLWRSDTAANVDDELQFHFEQKIEEFEAAGLTGSDARARAEAEFGDVPQVKSSLREIDTRVLEKKQRAEWWESFAQDLRYVVRSLGRSPMFTATVVVTLALGLGANAALFSFLDRLYLQTPGGVRDAASLRRVYINAGINKGVQSRSVLSFPEISAVRALAPEGMTFASYVSEKVFLGRDNDAPEVRATFVEGDYFGVLGVRAYAGRTFNADEYRVEGQSLVAIVSYALWQRHFAGAPDVIGKEIDLGSHRHVIVGVLPPGFQGTEINSSDIWVPRNTEGSLVDRPTNWYTRKDQANNQVIARVANIAAIPTFDQHATQSLRSISAVGDSMETTHLGSIVEARGGATAVKELAVSTRLAGVAVVILLIACANVVNLLLARASSREREVAVRLALGVSRRRLTMQLLTESIVLSLFAVVVALAVAYGTATALQTLLMPGVNWSSGVINLRVVLFTVLLALFIAVVSGIIPALQATRPNLSGALKSSVRDGGRRGSGARSVFLIAQTALSVVLLAGAGVFVRSLQGVQAIDLGYTADRLVYANIQYDRDRSNHDAEIQQRLPEAVERIRRIPGVENVALSAYVPMNGMTWSSLFLPDRDSLPKSGGMQRIMYQVTPEFFKATGVQVLRGRAFTEGDVAGRELVIAINETMAKNLWPGEDALTKCIIVGKREMPCRRVVAVVSPAHFNALIEGPSQLYYLPLAQSGRDGTMGTARAIVVRTTAGNAGSVGALLQRDLATFFGSWARPNVRTMAEVVAPQLRPWRTGAILFSAAGVLALIVAAVGVYSSIAYTVSQRTQEMGVRVALGASSRNIMNLVVREGVGIVVAGIAIGLALALALGSVVASMLYETSPRDPLVLAASTITLLVVAVVACSIPAWRASAVDPLSAMRVE